MSRISQLTLISAFSLVISQFSVASPRQDVKDDNETAARKAYFNLLERKVANMLNDTNETRGDYVLAAIIFADRMAPVNQEYIALCKKLLNQQ